MPDDSDNLKMATCTRVCGQSPAHRLVQRHEYTSRDAEITTLREQLVKSNLERFEERVLCSAFGRKLPYRLFVPAMALLDRNESQWPLVLLLHGGGGRGTDNRIQIEGVNAAIGAGIWTLPEHQEANPCFVLVPQCPPEPEEWTDLANWDGCSPPPLHPEPAKPLAMVMELLDEILKTQPVDANRLFLMGPSMGGFATWDWLVREPWRFAAAVPVCGGLAGAQAQRLIHIPVWIFHGDADDLVPASLSRKAYEELTAAGGQPYFTEYEEGGHAIAVYAWTEPGLAPWLFAQAKRPHQ